MGNKPWFKWIVFGLLISISLNLVVNSANAVVTFFVLGIFWIAGWFGYKNRDKFVAMFSKENDVHYEEEPVVTPVVSKTLEQTQTKVDNGNLLSLSERETWEALIGNIEGIEEPKISSKEKRKLEKDDYYDPPIYLTWDTFNIFKRNKKN